MELENIFWNIGMLWNSISAENFIHLKTSTIKTEYDLTIGLKILNCGLNLNNLMGREYLILLTLSLLTTAKKFFIDSIITQKQKKIFASCRIRSRSRAPCQTYPSYLVG